MLELRDGGRCVEGRWIWRHRDLEVGARERVALVGPTGSGKTLLLRSLAGLDPLDEGEVRYGERALEDWEVPAYRARVLYLPQEASPAEGTVEESLRVPFAFRVHAGRTFRKEAALELLEMLGRGEAFLRKRTGDLSGGERQIAALIRALLLEPEVLLLDEPAASMDDALARRAEALVDRWMAGGETAPRALLWTSHRGDRLERVTDRAVVL